MHRYVDITESHQRFVNDPSLSVRSSRNVYSARHQHANSTLNSESFASLSFDRDVAMSTPVKDFCGVPRTDESPIRGSSQAKWNVSTTSSSASLFSSTNVLKPSFSMVEIRQLCHCGYVEAGMKPGKVTQLPLKSNYIVDVHVEASIDDSCGGVFSLVPGSEIAVIVGKSMINLDVIFYPREEKTYIANLLITVVPSIRNHPPKKYKALLLGFGGKPSVRLDLDRISFHPRQQLQPNRLTIRSDNHYDIRLDRAKSVSLILKNTGGRAAFVCIKAIKLPANVLNQSQVSEVELSPKQLRISPWKFFLEKRVRRNQLIQVTVTCDKLWRDLEAGTDEIRLVIYYGPERQRLRLAKYAQKKKFCPGPIDGIDFCNLDIYVQKKQPDVDLGSTNSEDIRVFEEEIEKLIVRLLPSVRGASILEQKENFFGPVPYENDIEIEYDDDEVTCK